MDTDRIQKMSLLFPFCLLFISTTLLFVLNNFYPQNTYLQSAQIISGGTLFISSGLLFTLLLEYLSKRKFDPWEFIAFSLLGTLISFPLLLEIEFLVIGYIYDWFPLLNIFIITLLVFFTNPAAFLSYRIPNLRNALPSLPLFFFGLFLTIIAIIVFAYPALPDLDPYKWLFKYSYQFPNQQLDVTERPFFGALTFIAVKLSGASIFTFYKYIFPFLLSFIVFPAWLVARTITNSLQRILFMSLLLTSPVILLYGTTAMPQTPIIILAYFFLFFCLYSYLKNDDFYFYTAGIVIFFGYFYHPAASIILIGFAISLLIRWRYAFIKNKTLLVLLALLLVSNYERLLNITSFVTNWTNIVISRFFAPNQFNFIFPASYRNIDMSIMGWPGIDGVIKYYAFHVGPGVIFILLLFLWLLFQQNFRKYFFSAIKNPGIWVPLLSFFPFFIISEVLPRFPNLALLPDRAWIFGGIFSICFAYLFLAKEKLPQWLLWVGVASVVINISGALYINDLKKYLITPAQWRSAGWIVENLPENRIFLSSGNKNLLPIHAQTRLLKLPESIYCSNDIAQWEQYLTQINPDTFYSKRLEALPKGLQENANAIFNNQIRELGKSKTIEEKKNVLYENLQLLQKEISRYATNLGLQPGLPLFSPPEKNIPILDKAVPVENIYRGQEFNYTLNPQDTIYVYFSRMDERNPYGSRPYTLSTWGFRGCPANESFIFDQYPERFKRVYDDQEEIIIWKVL